MCTRTVLTTTEGRVVAGRNMDWAEDLHTNLWVYAAGQERCGENGSNALTWTSRYATLVATAYDVGAAEAVNTEGFVAHLLYLTEADFGTPGDRATLSVGAWVQYLAETCATVAEAVGLMLSDGFAMTAPALPNGAPSGVHVAVADASGDSAIFEYVDGALTVHHGSEFDVMTNSPTFDRQLAVNAYWEDVGDSVLPGTSRAADRFVRATHYLGLLSRDVDARSAAAGVLSVQRNAATPLVHASADHPEHSMTLWTSVVDVTDRRYYFQDTTAPNIFWVDLDTVVAASDAPVRKLDLRSHPVLAGEVSALFTPSDPFALLTVG